MAGVLNHTNRFHRLAPHLSKADDHKVVANLTGHQIMWTSREYEVELHSILKLQMEVEGSA
jgi:hypothetical protein